MKKNIWSDAVLGTDYIYKNYFDVDDLLCLLDVKL